MYREGRQDELYTVRGATKKLQEAIKRGGISTRVH